MSGLPNNNDLVSGSVRIGQWQGVHGAGAPPVCQLPMLSKIITQEQGFSNVYQGVLDRKISQIPKENYDNSWDGQGHGVAKLHPPKNQL